MPMRQPGRPERPGRPGRGRTLLGITVAVIVVATGLAVSAGSRGLDYTGDTAATASTLCEAQVRTMVPSPSWARFHSQASGSGTLTVTGTVDTQNGFGATVRSTYGCTVVMHGTSATATVDYLY